MSPEGRILSELISAAPAIAKEVREFAGVRGIDLGPEPPDFKADAARVRAEIDARRARRED